MIAYIALGSNLDDPLAQVQQALHYLQDEAHLKIVKVSSFYQSKALTLPDTIIQNDYINAVAMLTTDLSAMQLLTTLHKIESWQGRERQEKWAARTLDLDIVLYDACSINTEQLIIPHAQMQYRNFVLYPLFEIAGDIDIPGLGKLSTMVKNSSMDGLKKLINSV